MSTVGDDMVKLRKKRPERQLYVPPAQRLALKRRSEPTVKAAVQEIETTLLKNEEISDSDENDLTAFLNFLICRYLLSSPRTCNVNNKGILQFNLDTKSKCLNFRDEIGNIELSNVVHSLMCKTPLVYLQSSLALNTVKEPLVYLNKNIFPLYVIRSIIYLVNKLSVINLESYLDVLKDISFFYDCDIYLINDNYLFTNCYKDLYNHYFLWETFTSNRNELELLIYEKNQNKHSKTHKIIKGKDLPSSKASNLKNGHEEELEIMRKTKENINRKTRPLMKYVDRTNDTLDIKLNDVVKDWEELLDDDGELREDLLPKSEKNSKTNLTNVKETYDDDQKQIEELEHLVELYDFPSTFRTADLIQAFSSIGSDAMYIKWVDETHAILVLGTLTQALKAINLGNPLIKVRPMSMASKTSLAVVYKSDLKPAMKRPQTSLQAARRFISAHLGVKVGVSKEVMTKERDDLKAAREMKKISRQNERDAWEGNLKSCIK